MPSVFELAPLLFKFTGLKSNANRKRSDLGTDTEYVRIEYILLTLLRSRHRNRPEMQSTYHYVLYSCDFSAFSQKPIYIRNMSKLNNTSGAIPPQIPSESDPP